MSDAVRWYRVFGAGEREPDPEGLLAALHAANLPATAEFAGDERGWYGAELRWGERDEPVDVQRFLAGVDDIRSDLNSWAAWVEEQNGSDQDGLMQHLIGTRQLFVWQVAADDDEAIGLSAVLCDYLSRTAEGVYQVDGHGFFDVAGTHLVQETP